MIAPVLNLGVRLFSRDGFMSWDTPSAKLILKNNPILRLIRGTQFCIQKIFFVSRRINFLNKIGGDGGYYPRVSRKDFLELLLLFPDFFTWLELLIRQKVYSHSPVFSR